MTLQSIPPHNGESRTAAESTSVNDVQGDMVTVGQAHNCVMVNMQVAIIVLPTVRVARTQPKKPPTSLAAQVTSICLAVVGICSDLPVPVPLHFALPSALPMPV